MSLLLSLYFSFNSYADQDVGPIDPLPPFRPRVQPGIQLNVRTRDDCLQFTTALHMFQLIFTVELVETLCNFTNNYAREHIGNRTAMADGWQDLTVIEFYKYIALLYYMAIVELPNLELYWSTQPLFHGNWARAFMSKIRFKQFGCFLKISNYKTEDKDDKLAKVRFLHDYVRRKSMKLYQPSRNISIDERMVRNKGRYSFRQYIKDKPTKWGMKIWVLAESTTGYTYDYEVYTGRSNVKSVTGLGYDVVMKLCKSFLWTGL